MKIIEKEHNGCKPLYPIERFCPVDKALFIDIETTGLKKETSDLYLIGCGYFTPSGFETKLFFADSSDEEKDILRAFCSFSKDYTHMFHFNGDRFDIPYLLYKAEKYDMGDIFRCKEQIDIYRLCKPLRYLLFPGSMKQKAIESFLQIKREDLYNGGELIEVYKRYEKNNNEEDLKLLLTHNEEDVFGMPSILPILYYLDLYDADIKYRSYVINSYRDYDGTDKQEVIFSFSTDVYFPVSFISKTETMYVKASSKDGSITIRLPLYEGEMLLFFDNYRDYIYLPAEDTVIPKALATTLPKDRYQKATKDKCCQKVTGTFLKQPSEVFTPVLVTAYKDKKKYFRFPDCFNEKAADEFGRRLINIFFTMKRRSI